jgi:hypothetical protein
MQKVSFGWIGFLVFTLLLVSVACGSATPAPVPTSTPVPVIVTATATTQPTSTPPPTATPNIAATQEMDARQKLLQSYVDAGYISSTAGKFEELLDFHEEWPQLNWYQYWRIHSSPTQYGDLVFQAHFAWQTATRTSDLSGCGILFGLQPNKDHYAVFIDKGRIAFMMARGGTSYQVGKTRGTGRLSIQEPAEADVAVIVKGAMSYVLVNGDATQYTLSADQSSAGEFALSLLSGTNKDYGTRCDITHAYLWLPDE